MIIDVHCHAGYDYSFDEVGNRVSVIDNGVVSNYSTNELDQYIQIDLETFEYDKNGNLGSRTSNSGTTIYEWDEDDRLISLDRNEMHIDYHYDHKGLLVAKVHGGREIRYVWDGFDLITEINSREKTASRPYNISSGLIIHRYLQDYIPDYMPCCQEKLIGQTVENRENFNINYGLSLSLRYE